MNSPKVPNNKQPILKNDQVSSVWYLFFDGVVRILRKYLNPIKADVWTTATRPTNPQKGTIGFNDTLGVFEGYDGSSWVNLS